MKEADLFVLIGLVAIGFEVELFSKEHGKVRDMGKKTMLCVDTESLRYPELIGLNDEDIDSQEWLETYSTAHEARRALSGIGPKDNVWVVSCDDMEGINLAAALKRDNLSRSIELVSFGGTGSEVGRCQAAGIDLIRGKAEFVKRYSEQKNEQAFSAAREKVPSPVASSDEGLSSLRAAEPSVSDFEDVSQGGPGNALEPKSESASGKIMGVAASRSEKSARSGFIVSVLSGNGGVGKSTVAACLAVLFQEKGLKTVLVDLDLQFGDAGFLLGLDDVVGIDELVRQPERINQVKPAGGLPAVVGIPDKLEESEALVAYTSEVLSLLKSRFDAVVVNTGSFWSDCHIQVSEASDQVLFILDQRPSSVRSCSRALDLCARCGIAVQPFRFLLNLCSKHALLTSLDVSCALHGIQVGELKDGGREVGELLGAGLPLELASSKNPFIESLREIVPQLVPERLRSLELQEAPIENEKRTFFPGIRKRRTA